MAGLLFLGASQLNSFALVTDYVEAFDNSTITTTGPRSGGNNLAYWNIEGTNNGAFASYGVADFTIAALTIPAGEMLSSLNSLTFKLTQSNSGFTNSGGLKFYFSSDTSAIIGNGGGSSLRFENGEAPEGLGGQLASTYELGSGFFTEVASGREDVFTFDLDGLEPTAMDYLTSLFTTGGTLRFVVTPTEAGTAATYAGINSSSYLAPQVSLDYSTVAVPEPSAILLITLGGGCLCWRFLRRRAA